MQKSVQNCVISVQKSYFLTKFFWGKPPDPQLERGIAPPQTPPLRSSNYPPTFQQAPTPLTNRNPVVKVTPLFDAKINGYRYGLKGHSCYRRRIRNCTQAFECHGFQWPWVTSNPDFTVTILFYVKTRKWYEIQLYLQSPTNRNSHGLLNRAIFNDLEGSKPRFQGQAVLWRWISPNG